MGINEILKQATEYKKSNGYSYALDYLINSYDANKPDDLQKLLNKIYIYFGYDIENQKVKEFIKQLISSKVLEQYSGLLSNYFRMLQDLESYKLTIMNQISKVNPNNPWQYCYDIGQHHNSLCDYYQGKGLDNENNAIEFLYNLISSTFFDVAGELMMYDKNFTTYHSHLHYGNELRFSYPDRLILLSESVEGMFEDDDDDDSQCLKTLECKIAVEKINELIKQKIFYEFPKQLGFKIDILNKTYSDTANFALSFFEKEDFNDILILADKIKEWKIQIAGKTVSIASDETNNILKELYEV